MNSVTPRATTEAVAPPVEPTALADADAETEAVGLALGVLLVDALGAAVAEALGAAELAVAAASAGGFPAAPIA